MQAFCHGDLVQMRAAAGEAVALLRGLDAPVPLAYALTLLGAAVAMLDDVEGAQALLHEAAALSRPHDARVLVTVLTFAGFVARVRDDQSAAQRAWEEALGLARVLHLPYAALHLTAGLGRLASAQDDAIRARARFGEALASHVAADDLWVSPFYGRETVAFHFTWIKDPDAVTPVVTAIEDTLRPFDARPHWGKVFSVQPAAIAAQYPRFGDFQELVRAFDPEGKFRNDFADSYLFGDP